MSILAAPHIDTMPAATASPATATIDLIRATLGDRYLLERELGRGGMGTVYLARDIRLDRPVALKVLPPEFATQSTLRDRFLLETRTAASFSHPNIAPVTSALTRVGEVVGTPEYMSPEQASGDHLDGRSDLYALGLTAHFAATGRVAVTGESTQKILVKQLTEQISPIALERPDLPPALSEAIDRCVQKDRDDRFATAEALVEAIDAGQLAEPEIPLPIRLFAGEAGTMSMVGVGILLFSLYLIDSGQEARRSDVDIMLPVIVLLAILVTRMLTTLSEARRLAIAGFSTDDVMAGLSRVVAERALRREELSADAAVRKRRRKTFVSGLVILLMGVVMVWAALRMRIALKPGYYMMNKPVILMAMSGFAMLGISVVLLIKSPLRMPVGERMFRMVWLGPAGRLFIRFAGRGVQSPFAGTAVRTRSGAAAALAFTAPGKTLPARAPDSPNGDRMGALETRVAALERWRREQ